MRLQETMRICSLQIGVVKGDVCHKSAVHCIFVNYMVVLVVIFGPHLWAQASPQVSSPSASGRTIHGIVKSGNMPIPGAGISAANATTKEQVSTSTDVDGSYSLRIPPMGSIRYECRWQHLPRARRKWCWIATHPDVQANFELILLSRAQETRSEQRAGERGAGVASRVFPSSRVRTGQDAANGSMSDVVPSGMPVPGNCSGQRDGIRSGFGQHFQLVQFDER